MNNNNWQELENLFHHALELNKEDRKVYLTEKCRENKLLREEVETLIEAFEEKENFIEQPIFDFGLSIIHQSNVHTLAGETIGNYKILKKIGAGGMGEVYLAEDLELKRKIAVKFISPEFINNEWAKRQLIKEARAIAMLDHPNICQVFGVEETDVHSFIVMQYVEGATLYDLIRRDSVSPDQFLELFRQTAEALAHSHSHGIIHRDIKPKNIMVTTDGQVKMLDFGLAKTILPNNTVKKTDDSINFASKNVLIGTPAYMSPEQLKNEKLDFRSDIFSLGVVLYEIVSGKNPFDQNSDVETMSAILTLAPAPLNCYKKKFPIALNRITQKCLEKDRGLRYQSTSELLLDIQNIKLGQPERKFKVPQPVLLILVLSVLFLIIMNFSYFNPKEYRTLAILPFVNESSDMEADYLSDGLVEGLINRLTRSSKIIVSPYTKVSGYKGSDIDPLVAGRNLQMDAVLTGKIYRLENNFVIQVRLIRTSDGSQLWFEENIADDSNVLELQNHISEEIISKFNAKSIRTTTQSVNPEAYRFYMIGRHYWKKRDRENIRKAIDAFQQSIDLDPSYARAYAGLADSYVVLSSVAYGSMPTKEAMTKAKAAARQALDIDPESAESYTSLGVVFLQYDWNWHEAEKSFKRAIDLNPDFAPAHYWYSILLVVTGRMPEAIMESEKARDLDPFSPLTSMNLGRTLYFARRFDEAIKYFNKILEDVPNDSRANYMLGLIYLQKGMYKESLEKFDSIYVSNKLLGAAPLGHVYGKMGRTEKAINILNEIEELAKIQFIPPQERAIVYLGLNNKDETFVWLERACQDRFATFISINVDPLFDSLRTDPRFDKLVRCMNTVKN